MFDVDVKGLAELEAGRPPHRLACEPVANVFDEYRGYGSSERRRPSFCAVTLSHSANPRGVTLAVADDGAGFQREADIWTFFGTTEKRSAAGVSGRFNAGDKQLLALARHATVKSNRLTVTFADGKRDVTRHRQSVFGGVEITALMPWTLDDLRDIRQRLGDILPPAGLRYTVDGATIKRPAAKATVRASLPTVILDGERMRSTVRKTAVEVLPATEPMLYELGIPVCSLGDIGFPWSLDVQQKVPVPMSRDVVAVSYLYRLIGSVLEQAAMDGIELLTDEQQGAGFVRDALEWVREPEALAATVKAIYGEHAVRQSSDPIANAQAAATGATLVPGRWFGEGTRKRLGDVMPTAKEKFGGAESLPKAIEDGKRCSTCGRPF